MKDMFPGHFPNIYKESAAWRNGLLILDANILLNLYRYSENSREEFISILEAMKERLWIPNRVAEEYLNSRVSTILSESKKYESTIKSIKQLKNELNQPKQHPFIKGETMDSTNNTFDGLISELEENKDSYKKLIQTDPIRDKITTIFEYRVGASYPQESLKEILKNGELRFIEKTPPGYKDIGKLPKAPTHNEKVRTYSDYIIWQQIIDQAKTLDSDVIFVTDDKKEDWWTLADDKPIHPRPELALEFNSETNKSVCIYNTLDFLKKAKEHLHAVISQSTVEEIQTSYRNHKDPHINFINQNEILYESSDTSHPYIEDKEEGMSILERIEKAHQKFEELEKAHFNKMHNDDS